MIADFLYGLCALTAFLCAGLLLHAYYKSSYRLLLWGGLCFAGLTLNNILVMIDKQIGPSIDLSTLRLLTVILSLSILLYGLIYDSE